MSGAGTGPSVLSLLAAVVAARWRIAGGMVAAGILAFAGSFLLTPSYRVESSVMPSAQLGPSGGLAALAAMQSAASSLGLSLGSGDDPSALFPAILESRPLSERLLDRNYPTADGDSLRLLDALDGGEAPRARRLQRAQARLHRDHLGLLHDRRSGITTIRVDFDDPVVAAALASVATDELDRFNREARSSQAAQQVRFVSSRMHEVEAQLAASEERLREFHEKNRTYATSPQLVLEEARLRRDVELNQELFLTLRTQYELARIDEMKNLPVIAVLDPPVIPTRPHRPQRARLALGWAMLAGFVGVLAALGASLRSSAAQDPAGARILAELERDLRRVRRRPAAPVGGA